MTLALARALTVGSVLWVLMLLAAPAAVGMQLLANPAAFLYAASAEICHQITERSFAMSGIQLPVCARCFGLYFSSALGAAAAWFAAPTQLRHTRLLLALAALPTGITWGLEAAGLAGFSNLTRALAALPLGGAAGWVFVQMLRYDSESHGREIHHSRTPARFG